MVDKDSYGTEVKTVPDEDLIMQLLSQQNPSDDISSFADVNQDVSVLGLTMKAP